VAWPPKRPHRTGAPANTPTTGDVLPTVPDASSLALFSVAAAALLLVPGPAVLYIVAQSIHGGRAAGLVSVLGVHVGTLVHVVAVSVGLSSLLVSSATAFEIVKYAGAAYLVVLGVRRLLARDDPLGGKAQPARRRPHRRLFVNGIVVNVLNPKTALFFFAFLPQFVDVDAGSAGLQMLVLGLVFIALGLVSDGAYALAAGTAGSWLRSRPRAVRAERYVSGSVFLGLGLVTALSGSRHRA
jgi:threonine/homoserine/homoserine lactone efflux protein